MADSLGPDADLFGNLEDFLDPMFGPGYVTEQLAEAQDVQYDDAGYRVNENGDRLYAWSMPNELGGSTDGLNNVGTGWYTREEIENAWNAEQGMGYFKKSFEGSFDDYMAFIDERTQLFNEGVLGQEQNPEWVNQFYKENGRMPVAGEDFIPFYETEQHKALMDKYGIPTGYQNEDGDIFEFNGSTFTKTYKAEDHLSVGDILMSGLAVAASAYLGPQLAAALGGGAAGAGASAAIINQAFSLMQGQGLNLGDAITAAGMAVLGQQFEEMWGQQAQDAVGEAETIMKEMSKYSVDGVVEGTTAVSQATWDKMVEVLKGAAEAGQEVSDWSDIINQVIGGASDIGDIVWDQDVKGPAGTGYIDENGNWVFTAEEATVVAPPDYSVEQEKDAGGETATPEQQAETQQPTTEGERQGNYVYEGNGIFRDVVDGDVWYVPNPVGVNEGDYVDDTYMETNNAQNVPGSVEEYVPPTEEQGKTTEEEEVVDILTPPVIDTTVDTVTETTTQDQVTDTTTDTATETPTQEQDTQEQVTEEKVTEQVADGTETTGDTGTGTGTGDGTGDGTDDGTGDGAEVPATGMLSGTKYEPFMAGINYQAPVIPELIQTPQKDYVAALDGVINRSLFEGMV